MRGRTPDPLLILAGPPGVGKTAVREELAQRLGALSLDPGSGHSWPFIYQMLDVGRLAVLECCRLPRALRSKLVVRQGDVALVELVASEELRRARLENRGETPQRIRELLREDGLGLGYEQKVRVDLTIETIDSPAAIAAQIADWWRTR